MSGLPSRYLDITDLPACGQVWWRATSSRTDIVVITKHHVSATYFCLAIHGPHCGRHGVWSVAHTFGWRRLTW